MFLYKFNKNSILISSNNTKNSLELKNNAKPGKTIICPTEKKTIEPFQNMFYNKQTINGKAQTQRLLMIYFKHKHRTTEKEIKACH